MNYYIVTVLLWFKSRLSTVDVGYYIIERSSDRDQVGDLRATGQMVDGAGQTESRRVEFHARRRCAALAFNKHAECASRSLDLLKSMPLRKFDDLGNFGTDLSVRDIVDKLLENPD